MMNGARPSIDPPNQRSKVRRLSKHAKTLGQALRVLRKSRGLTLQDLADASRSHVGNLSRIERDLSRPGLDLLFRLADAMNYSMATVFSFTEMDTDLNGEQATLLSLFITLSPTDRALLIDFATLLTQRSGDSDVNEVETSVQDGVVDSDSQTPRPSPLAD